MRSTSTADPKARARRYRESSHGRAKIAAYRKTQACRDGWRRHFETPAGRSLQLWHAARRRAALRGLEFTLDLALVRKWARKGTCMATGVAIDWIGGRGVGPGRNVFGPSLDRLNADKGYTNKNTRLTVWAWNALKGTATDAEAWAFIEEARRNRRSR